MNRNRYNLERVSPAELYDVVSAASSQDPSRVQASARRLKEMLELGGTYDALHEIAAQKSLPSPIRQQSIIQFKNVATYHWKSRKLLTDEERARIRTRSLTLVDEADNVIAECNELIIAKIARHDFPGNWPSLIDEIIGYIDASLHVRYNSPDSDGRAALILRRGLKALEAILKEFSSIKMLHGVRTMGQMVEKLHLKLSGYYTTLSASFSALDPSSISPRSADDILLAHLAYKSIVKMAVWIWSQSDKAGRDVDKFQPWFQDVFQSSIFQAKSMIGLRANLIIALSSSPSTMNDHVRRSLDRLTRHVRLFGKLFRELQRIGVARFVALPMCNDLVLFYWSNVEQATNGPPELIADSSEAVYPVRFLVQAMVLFKENLTQWTPERRDGTANITSLSQEFVENAVRLLVTQLIPLRTSDLEGWMSDPEEWVNVEEKEDEQWEFELRPCGERVLMTLARQYEPFVKPLLAMTFKEIATESAIDLPAIIRKEALYCAIGRCATHLKDVIPFERWLAHTLVAEARETNTSYPIIKRRIAWLIGKWITSMCMPANSSAIWDVLAHLLQDRGSGTDAVVRFTAATVVKMCVDSIEFDVDVFAPYLASVVTELMLLIGEADTADGKRRIVTVLHAVIQHSGKNILPLTEIITKPLPQLWITANEDWLFKASLITTMIHLITATNGKSTHLGNIAILLIRESLSPGPMSYLDTDGLTLWHTALKNSNGIQSVDNAPALIDLFPLCLSLLSTNLDLLGKIMDIVRSYFILDGPLVLQSYAVDIFNAFLTAFNSKPASVNMKDMIIAINLLIQLTSSAVWGEALHISGFFAHSLSVLIDDKERMLILTEHVQLLARIAMSDPQIFLQLMAATAASQNKTESVLYEALLDQWWNTFDSMSEPRHRKLAAMGIAALVSTGRPEVLRRLPTEIFNLWGDVFGEIKEVHSVAHDSSGITPSSHRQIECYWEQNEPPLTYFQGSEGTPEYDRRKAVYENDPVRTTLLTAYIAARLREAEVACGGTEIFEKVYLAEADPLVLKQIQVELVGT